MPTSKQSGSLLIIGGTGELGRATVAAACDEHTQWTGSVCATYHSAPPSESDRHTAEWIQLDCAEHKEVRALLASAARRIVAVIYCAVPKHRGANEDGSSVRVRAGIVDDVVAAAEAAAMIGARFIAISTDLVFSGDIGAGCRYSEDAVLNPKGAYGKYKAEMEHALANISGRIVIARSSLILSMDLDAHSESSNPPYYGKAIRFVVECIEGKHGNIQLFEDELRCMSFADDQGRALVELANPTCSFSGVIHLVADEVTNRWELAKKLARKLGLEDKLGVFATNGLSKQSGFNRPLNCALATQLTKQVLNTKIRGITERLG